jgi:hypothetical protein
MRPPRVVSGKKGRVKEVSVAGDPERLIAKLEALAAAQRPLR